MNYVLLFLSGILTAVPFINQRLSFLAWFSLAPLFYAAQTKKGGYSLGLAFGAGYYGTLYYWFIYLYPLDFAGLDRTQSAAVIAVAWVGMTLLQSIGTALVPLAISIVCRKKNYWYAPFAAAAAWTLAEWLQTLTWMGVPWGRIAVSQYSRTEIIQVSSLFGSLFLGFIIALVNAYIARGFIFTKSSKSRKIAFIAAGGIFAANFIYGVLAININNVYSTDSNDERIKVALIQGNISSGEKWADNSLAFSLERYKTLTLKAYQEYSPDIIIWPETVIPVYLRYDDARFEIAKLARDCNSIILVGAYDAIYDDLRGEYVYYNAIMAFYSDSGFGGDVYYKRHLVPFGEYLPIERVIRTFIPPLAELNVFKNSLTAGSDTALITTDYGKIGGLVCFDSIYETLTLSSVREGAELIVLATNDSWYRDSSAVYQHNGHAVLRAVECGRYIARAANTGVSSIIRPDGSIVDNLPPLITGNLYGEIAFIKSQTLYSRVGNIIIPVSAVLLGVFTALSYGVIPRIYSIIKKSNINDK